MRNRRFRTIFWDIDGGGGSAPPDAPALPDTALTGPEPPADAPAESPPAEAPKLPDTVLTAPDTPEGEGEGEKPKEGGQEDAQPDAKPEAPEGYDLAFAEGVQVDTDLLGQFQKTAHEMGLTKGQAQKLADLYAGQVDGLHQKYQAAQFNALNEYIIKQNAELYKRPDIEAELGLAKKALREFGSDELTEVFRTTGMGSHAAMLDFMVKVGRALGEPEVKGTPGRSADRPLYEQIWGKDGLGASK